MLKTTLAFASNENSGEPIASAGNSGAQIARTSPVPTPRRKPLSRAARRTIRELDAMRSYQVTVTGGREAVRNAALVKLVRELMGDSDSRGAKEKIRETIWGFCYTCKTRAEADALQGRFVAAGADCTVKYVDAYGNPVGEDGVSPHVARRLAERCAQARALMEQAEALIKDVLEDPAYDPDALPYGVCPDGVDLCDAIGMLIPELRPVTD